MGFAISVPTGAGSDILEYGKYMQPFLATEGRTNAYSANRSQQSQAKVGLFSIGLDVYWPQFQGLKERLIGYNESIAARLKGSGATVIKLGLIDTAEKASTAAHQFRQSDVDLIFLHAATYALSSTLPARCSPGESSNDHP